MGTRTIKPLSNNAGQLGSSTKYWNKGYINELYINEIHTSSTSTLSAYGISIKPEAGIVFEGATPDEFETQLIPSNPTADRIVVLPDATGTLALTSDIGVTSLSGTTANGLTTYASAGTLDVEQYLTFENSGNTSTLSLLSNEDTGDKFSIATTTNGATTISTVDDDTTLAHLTLDVHGDITLDAMGKNVYMARDGSNVFDFNVDTSSMKIMDTTDSGDYFKILTDTHGATTLSTVDDDATAAHLNVDIDGDIVLDAGSKNTYIAYNGFNIMHFDLNAGTFKIMDTADSGDYFSIATTTHGATTLTTVDDDSDAAHLTLDADGNIVLDAVCDHATTGIVLQNEGTQFGLFNIHHSASYFTLYENGGASTDDFGSFRVEANGKTTISTWDTAGTDADIVLDAEGNIEINAEAGVIDFKDSSAQLAKISSGGLDFTDNIDARVIFEGGTNNAHQTALGVVDPTQDNTVSLPNASGTVQLQGTSAGKQIQAFSCNFFDNIGTTKHYLPFKDINEQIYAYQDEVSMLAPCDGRVVSVTLRPQSLSITSDATLTVGINTKAVGVSIYGAYTSEETEALVVTNTGDDSDNHVFHFAFDNAKHFESTEMFSVSLQSNVSVGANSFWHATVVVEWDWTTFLGSTSAEIDSTP